MAASSFGTFQEEPDKQGTGTGGQAAGPNGAASELDVPQETFDINDPAFTSEALDVNVDANAYEQPTPPPDRKWRAKLKLLKQTDDRKQEVDYVAAKWGQDKPQMVLVANVQAIISDPSGKYDGLSAFDRTVSTFLMRSGGTKVQTFLAALRKPDGTPYVTKDTPKMVARQWMDLLTKALAGEPEVGIESQWEWSCAACADEARKSSARRPRGVVGMHHFPPSPKVRGEYDPEMKCAVNPAHGYSRARVQIANVFPLAQLK